MGRKKHKKPFDWKIPRKVKIRRGITNQHRNKYAKDSKFKHTAWGTYSGEGVED